MSVLPLDIKDEHPFVPEFGRPPTTIKEGVAEARHIVEEAALTHGPIEAIFLMLSGGNDSMVLLDVCKGMADAIVHINTGIGIPETNQFVRDVVRPIRLPFHEMHPPVPYRDIVLGTGRGARPDGGGALFGGFPGPGSHHFIYTRLKERCVEQLIRDHRTKRGQRFMLLTGIRNAESQRRMGYAHATDRKGGQVWVNPLIRWSNDLMREYRTTRNLPVNEVTKHLHMSGECLCGAFAHPGELEEIGFFYPEFVARIRALEAEARDRGLRACRWGERAPEAPPTHSFRFCRGCGRDAGTDMDDHAEYGGTIFHEYEEVVERRPYEPPPELPLVGPMCQSCDFRAPTKSSPGERPLAAQGEGADAGKSSSARGGAAGSPPAPRPLTPHQTGGATP